ncbi:MAG: S8 family serine peptidase [Candidatus Delongbacteria bacterium]|nr:S8 family serine peptidase [Candidatus Delongbacteria bacterium]MCG2760383.1 S8 family serine peptidase [Candidatus Delongbacteria bacterium]
MRKAKWFIVIMFVLFAAMTFMSAQETKIINGYKVTRGERPAIDLSKVTPDAYETGRIWVKLAPEMEEFIKDDVIHESKVKGAPLSTGVGNIDRINTKYGIEKIRPKQYGYYETSPAAIKYRDRHKAWGFHLWMEVYLPEGTDVIAAVKDFIALDEVEFAEPVYKDVLFDSEPPSNLGVDIPKVTPNDTRYNEQWHYHNTGQAGGTPDCDIDLPEAWDIERGNSQVLVAVQDMGIQYTHPDLDAHIWSGLGYDFQAMDSTIDPGFHGTHVSGTISAESNNGTGVAGIAGGSGSGDGVTLMSVQVYAADGSGGGNSNLPYEYSADNDAAISQNSWGYTTVGNYDQLVLDGIDYFNAYGGGTTLDGGLVIFAAGNSNATGLWYPGCYSGAMAVSATNFNDVRSYYSNYGSWVEIAAPGGEYYTTEGQILSTHTTSIYDWLQGTSMACPHVTGVASLILSLAPGVFTNQEVRDILSSTTDYIDDKNPTYAGLLGTGRLNANAALNEVLANLSNVERPASIAADAVDIDQIDIGWEKNAANDDVMLVFTTDGIFGTPVNGTTYSVSQTIPGGGVVLTTGSGTSYSHSGLTDYTDYYYRAYSFDNSEEYSAPRSTSTRTLMAPMIPSDVSMGFEKSGSIPDGWTQEGNWTFITTTTRPTAPSEGSYFAHFRTVSSTKKIVTPRFDLTNHTGVTIIFDYLVSSRKVGPTTWFDKLKVYYKTSSAGSWVLLSPEYSGAYTTWQTATLNISDAVRTNDFYFAFEAIEGGTIGYGVSVDDIVINGIPSGDLPPAAPVNVVTNVAGTDLTVSWDAVGGATNYDVYSSDDPYGTFTYVTNVSTNSYLTSTTEVKLFWYIIAKN